MTELSTTSDDSFSPEEQAQFDAMQAGDQGPVVERAPEPEARRPERIDAPAPEPVAEKAPETGKGEPEAKEADDGDDDGENRGQFVRHAKYNQERERRKAAEARAAAAEESRARLDERLRIFGEASRAAQAKPTEAKPEPPARIDPKEDIFGAYEQMRAEVEELRGGFTRQTEETRARAQGEATLNEYRADAQRFAAAEPTFSDAYLHLYRSRGAELQRMGVPNDQIMAQIARDEFEIVQAAKARGVSPAQEIYEIAKARGFVPKVPEPAEPAAPAPESPAEKATREQKGALGPGRSLSNAGGEPAGTMPTVEQLANMSEDEFARFAKKNPRALDALMGG